jgi:biotin carboxyl carrier protein
LPGRILDVAVSPGDSVTLGQRLLTIEAMKMENEVSAPRAGTVVSVTAATGDRIELGDELLRII